MLINPSSASTAFTASVIMSKDTTPNPVRTKSTRRSPVIPVSLTEASLDSPTFRTTTVHFADQVDGIERWLDGYVRSTSKLAQDVISLEESINSYLRQLIPTQAVADTVIDNEYTQLALKRVGDGARDYWTQIQALARRMDVIAVEPIKLFLQNDLRAFKDARRTMDNAQKAFDTTLARYLSMPKTKEPSSLREDAFAVFETRKVYLKSSLDFCQLAPQLRYSLDRLLVRISSDLWGALRQHRGTATNSAKWNTEIDRIRGWCKDMESSEAVFKRELHLARREIGEATLLSIRPSRDLESYSSSTVAFLSSRGPSSANAPKEGEPVISECQGWLFFKVLAGKPVRTSWTRRWFYCRDGIFGWLVQAPHGVLQGDEIGVLLCNAKPAVGEDRRFCFQVKTKSQTMILQAETQGELSDWLEVFEVAKKRAFEASVGKSGTSTPSSAFSITPPNIPEFSAKVLDAIMPGEDGAAGALVVPNENLNLAQRSSFDVNAPARRSISNLGRELAREDGESNREHAARIIQKLDLHRKATFGAAAESPQSGAGPAGGIASLISASHTFLPGYSSVVPRSAPVGGLAGLDIPPGSLAPPYLAPPPIATNLSRFAVTVTAERGLTPDISRAMSTAVMANYWGSNPWSSVYTTTNVNYHRLTNADAQQAAAMRRGSSFRNDKSTGGGDVNPPSGPHHPDRRLPEWFPPGYPPELKAQHAQFRLLFPNVPMEEKLVLVFRATWTSSGERGFEGPTLAGNGRIYVTPDNMYFYGQQLGLVVAYSIGLDFIAEVTANPGRDCDFIVLRLSQDFNDTGLTRITIKTFLEDVRLLHARLNLLVDDLQAEEPMEVSEIVTQLICLEKDEHEKRSPSMDSWEDVGFDSPVAENHPLPRRPHQIADNNARPCLTRHRLRSKVHLPTAPVIYEPDDMKLKVAERHFEIGAKSCFHILFGDKSFLFPKLYFDRNARDIVQGPWVLADHGRMKREFTFKADSVDMLGRSKTCNVTDFQTIDIHRDHVTYEVTHVKRAWHLPHSQYFKVVTKIVITHIAKSKCKLAIYIKTEWKTFPSFSKSIVERQALNDAEADAEELAEAATDQVRRLGPRSRTKRAIQVYGHIGQETQPVPFTPAHADSAKKQAVQPRTLTEMVYETLKSLTQSAVTSILMWAFAALRVLLRVFTAHRVILVVTGFSLLANLFLTSLEGSAWWRERSATRFLARLGVGPNVMMSKAVYIADLESVQGTMPANISWAEEGSVWYVFSQLFFSSLSLLDAT